MSTKSVKVTVTGGAGNIGYILSFLIGTGKLLGQGQKVDLTLLEIPPVEKALKGVIMEIKDAALPLLNSVKGTVDQKEGFKDCEIALLVGARPRGKGMDRKDLLQANASIFKFQAKCLDEIASKNVKVVVVGNPANTNAGIINAISEKINPKNITSLTRLDMNRAVNQVSEKLGVSVSEVRNIVIWGNHSKSQFPDLSNAEIKKNGKYVKVIDQLDGLKWVEEEFVPTVRGRGSTIIQARGLSSTASAALAICDHVNSWVNGTSKGEFVAMGVMSDGSYGVPEGINFGFPVTCKNGEWTIVKGLDLSSKFSKKAFEATLSELKNEKEIALAFLKDKK